MHQIAAPSLHSSSFFILRFPGSMLVAAVAAVATTSRRSSKIGSIVGRLAMRDCTCSRWDRNLFSNGPKSPMGVGGFWKNGVNLNGNDIYDSWVYKQFDLLSLICLSLLTFITFSLMLKYGSHASQLIYFSWTQIQNIRIKLEIMRGEKSTVNSLLQFAASSRHNSSQCWYHRSIQRMTSHRILSW